MKEDELICPVCEKGHLLPQTYSEEFRYRGKTLRVDGLEGYLCDTCGADPVFEDQIRRGHSKFQDARRRADGLLTGPQIRDHRNRLGLTQQQASRIFGGGTNAFSKYERAEVIQSVAMDRLIRTCARHPEVLAELADEAGVVPEAKAAGKEYVTASGTVKAALLKPARRDCDIVSMAAYRKTRSTAVSADWENAGSDESSDREEA